MPRRTANNQLARAGEGRAGEVLAASATVMAAQDALPPPASVALAKSPLPDTAIVPVALRHDGWTPDRQRAFIEALADSGCVKSAADTVGISVVSAYRLRRRSDARAFDAAWEAALECSLQQLLPVAIDRALNGTVRQRWYHGELIAEERVHHDRLLLHLLQKGQAMLGHVPARRAIADDWTGAMERLEAGEGAAPAPVSVRVPDYRVWQDEHGCWLTNCPPPRYFDGYAEGQPGGSAYMRTLTNAERDGMERMRGARARADEAARRRIFGLPQEGD